MREFIKLLRRTWGLVRHRRELRYATIYPSHFGQTKDDIVWSKAFVRGMANVYPPRTASSHRHLVVSMRRYQREIENSPEPVVAVYVVGSHVREFVEDIFPRLTRKIVLVAGDADNSMPSSVLGSKDAAMRFLNDERLVGAWIQNLDTEHPKAYPLPIGLDLHSAHINKNQGWQSCDGSYQPNSQENQAHTIAADAPPFAQRDQKVFTHFTVNTNLTVRAEWLEHLKSRSFSDAPEGEIARPELWRKMAQSQFVASPPGGGMDCHRTWEALVLGSTPIVQHFAPMAPLFEDLPVWQVDSISDVTPESLRQKSEEISGKIENNEYDFGKLTVGWWKEFLDRQIVK